MNCTVPAPLVVPIMETLLPDGVVTVSVTLAPATGAPEYETWTVIVAAVPGA